MTSKSLVRIFQLCLLGVFLGTLGAWYQVNGDMKAERLAMLEPAAGGYAATSGDVVVATGEADVGGVFSLTDHYGTAVTEADYDGSYKLVFFGFTYCPEICPTELKKMALALEILGEEGKDIQPLFITTDPERDTAEVMKEYVELYHPRLVGLTGTMEQIDEVKQTYRVYAEKAQDPEMSDYTMNHSAYTYLMGPDNKLVDLFSSDDTPAEIASKIERLLKQS